MRKDAFTPRRLTASNKHLVRPVLISQLWGFSFAGFLQMLLVRSQRAFLCCQSHEFDGDLLIVQKIGPLEDDTE